MTVDAEGSRRKYDLTEFDSPSHGDHETRSDSSQRVDRNAENRSTRIRKLIAIYPVECCSAASRSFGTGWCQK